MLDNFSVDYGYLRGVLAAFARINEKPNYAFSFEFDLFEKSGAVQVTLEQHFSDFSNDIELLRLDDWHSTVRQSLEKWLFAFQPTDTPMFGDYHLIDPQLCFALSEPHLRQTHISDLVNTIDQLVNPIGVWSVLINPNKWYEGFWEDFALESQSYVFLLHLGVSD